MRSLSVVATIVLVVSQAATAAIAGFIPLSRKDEARRKMRAAMSQYVILDSLKAGQPDKSRFLNRVINRMRELAPAACFRQEEIAAYLESVDLGERSAALASVQWQWKNSKVNDVMHFTDLKKPSELPGPSDHPSSGYFPQLLKVLCGSWDQFENYHATVAMWSMVESLKPKDKQELFKRVLDPNAVPIHYKCNEWGKFIQYLKDKDRYASPVDDSRWPVVNIELDPAEALKAAEILLHLAALIDPDDRDGLRDAYGLANERLEEYLLTDAQFSMLRHPLYRPDQRTDIARCLRIISAKVEGQLPGEAKGNR